MVGGILCVWRGIDWVGLRMAALDYCSDFLKKMKARAVQLADSR